MPVSFLHIRNTKTTSLPLFFLFETFIILLKKENFDQFSLCGALVGIRTQDLSFRSLECKLPFKLNPACFDLFFIILLKPKSLYFSDILR